MTPKAELFGRIEDYCLNLLDAKEKREFERELATNEELREEVQLQKDIQTAILEMDVIDLKGTLEEIHNENVVETPENGSFSLLEELTEIEELKDELTFDELIDSFESMPKVHVYQHEKTSNENVHRFYEEQFNGSDAGELDDIEINGFDSEGLEGLEEAILEDDILNLRETLQQVAKSVEPQYSAEQIDEYLNGEMGDEILAEFEEELKQNSDLLEEVSLHKDIELAIDETDIMNLRDEMKNIMETETSWNVSEQSIEDFIDGLLEEDLLEEFGAELKENTDLMAEVKLREQINHAVGEKDVQTLRASLKDARNSAQENEVKSFALPKLDLQSTRFWRNSVAMVIVLVGLIGILNTSLNTVDNTYNKFYEAPTWASERSTSSVNDLNEAKLAFQNQNFDEALNTLDGKDDFVSDFYRAASYQGLNKYEEAANNYSRVIEHGNNLFIEESEWYRALCYVKMNDKAKATQELLAVIQRKGHYEKDAKALQRKLKYKLK